MRKLRIIFWPKRFPLKASIIKDVVRSSQIKGGYNVLKLRTTQIRTKLALENQYAKSKRFIRARTSSVLCSAVNILNQILVQ